MRAKVVAPAITLEPWQACVIIFLRTSWSASVTLSLLTRFREPSLRTNHRSSRALPTQSFSASWGFLRLQRTTSFALHSRARFDGKVRVRHF
jgi:hypothetical protein